MRITYLKLIATVFFWGTNFAMGKIALESFDAFSAAFIRFVVGTTLLFGMLYFREGQVSKLNTTQLIWAIAAGFLGVFLYNACFFLGLQNMPTVRASLIIAISPITVTLGSSIFLGEKVSLIKWLGIIVSIIGAMLVIARGDFTQLLSQATWGIGEFYILGAVFAWTVYTLLAKSALKTMSALTLSAFSTSIGCILLLFPAAQHGLFQKMFLASWQSYFAVIYMGITATALGYIWYYDAVQKIGVTKAAIVGNLTPVFAVMIAVSFLGEELTLPTLIGGVLVLIGILFTTRK